MKVKSIPSTWIYREKHRLDCGPYMSGALEARMILEALPIVKTPLGKLTKGHAGGIYNGPMFKRNYVASREHGVPFLTSSSMLLADLSNVGLLRKKDAQSKKLSYLRLEEGMTLISCSGSIGRMVYVRPEMAGMWSSQDNLKVVPDRSKILPGYLYAFLSSKFGVPQVVSGTYGAIIQHIEPEHIANLPVPRLGEKIERQVHDLVQQAAEKRAHATKLFHQAKRDLLEFFGEPPSDSFDKPWCQVVSSNEVASQGRMEGFFYNPWASAVERWVKEHPVGFAELGHLADVFDVPPFKHIYVEDEYGLPFYPSGELFLLARKPNKFLSKVRTKGLAKYVIKRDWVLLARSGQLGGIIGRPQYADSTLHNATTSDHVIRVVSKGKAKPGYLYAYLALDSVGYPLVTKTIAGKSVPALWPEYLNRVPVLTAPDRIQERVHAMVVEAFESRVEATDCENTSRQMLESCIEEQAD